MKKRSRIVALALDELKEISQDFKVGNDANWGNASEKEIEKIALIS